MALTIFVAIGLAMAGGSRVPMSQHRMRVRGGALMVDTPAVAAEKLPPVSEGANEAGLKTITLTHPANGDSATLYTFGGCVTSYKHAGVETLKVRPDAKMDGSKPISGGIPHCFPQFGPGAIQQHGFARNLEWELLSSATAPEPSVRLRLADSPKTREMWPHPFEAVYTVTLAEDRCAPAAPRRAAGARYATRARTPPPSTHPATLMPSVLSCPQSQPQDEPRGEEHGRRRVCVHGGAPLVF